MKLLSTLTLFLLVLSPFAHGQGRDDVARSYINIYKTYPADIWNDLHKSNQRRACETAHLLVAALDELNYPDSKFYGQLIKIDSRDVRNAEAYASDAEELALLCNSVVYDGGQIDKDKALRLIKRIQNTTAL